MIQTCVLIYAQHIDELRYVSATLFSRGRIYYLGTDQRVLF